MPDERTDENIGHQLGTEAIDHGERHAAEYCLHERQRLRAVNEPRIMAIRCRIAQLQEQDREVEERIRKAPPPGDVRSRRQKALRYWVLTFLLAVAAFAFAILTFDPFRLGFKGILYALGVAVITPLFFDETLDAWETRDSTRLYRLGVTAAFCMALTGQLLLGAVRADLFAEQLHSASPAVVIEGQAAGREEPTQIEFYESTARLLPLALALFSIAMEIGTGVTFLKAQHWSITQGEDADELRARQRQIRDEMIALGQEQKTLENAPVHFEHQFERDFHHSQLNGAKKAGEKKNGKKSMLPLILCGAALCGATLTPACARTRPLNLVIAPDLSASERVIGTDGNTEFAKNLAAISRLLANAPAGAKVTVLGITGESFGAPYVVLEAELNPDAGYFQEKLAAARGQLMHAWHEHARKLSPNAKHTCLFGALRLASQVFQENGRRNVLVIFSDMRQDTGALDLESTDLVSGGAMSAVEKQKLLPDLHGVEVYALGVDAAGKTKAYWESLRAFWTAYFKKAGADLREYTVFRDPPPLTPAR